MSKFYEEFACDRLVAPSDVASAVFGAHDTRSQGEAAELSRGRQWSRNKNIENV